MITLAEAKELAESVLNMQMDAAAGTAWGLGEDGAVYTSDGETVLDDEDAELDTLLYIIEARKLLPRLAYCLQIVCKALETSKNHYVWSPEGELQKVQQRGKISAAPPREQVCRTKKRS